MVLNLPSPTPSPTPEDPSPRSVLTRVLRRPPTTSNNSSTTYKTTTTTTTTPTTPTASLPSNKSLRRRFWFISPSNSFPQNPYPPRPSTGPLRSSPPSTLSPTPLSTFPTSPYRPRHATTDSLRLGYSTMSSRPISRRPHARRPTSSLTLRTTAFPDRSPCPISHAHSTTCHPRGHHLPASIPENEDTTASIFTSTTHTETTTSSSTPTKTYTLTSSSFAHTTIMERSSSLALSLRVTPRTGRGTGITYGTTLPQKDKDQSITGFSFSRYIRPGGIGGQQRNKNSVTKRSQSNLGL